MSEALETNGHQETGLRIDTDPRPGVQGKPRILVIEDDPEMRALVSIELRSDGFEVVSTANSDEFLQVVETLATEYGLGQDAISLIVSDVRMPGLDGLGLLAALRCASWRTPVVLMTAFGSQETHEEAARLGAVVLDKPFEMEKLAGVARRLVRR
jgi:DNA-binding response OmpR family regulator